MNRRATWRRPEPTVEPGDVSMVAWAVVAFAVITTLCALAVCGVFR